MVHISSAAIRCPAPLGWALVASAGLHLLLLWPARLKGPQQTPVASTIKAELRLPAQVAARASPPEPVTDLPAASPQQKFDSRAGPAVPNSARTLPPPPRQVNRAADVSRQMQPETPFPLALSGDALTRYRLALAWQLGRDAVLHGTGLPARPVTVELVVVLVEGRAVNVLVSDDGGSSALAARAARQARLASRAVVVPPELGRSPLRVSLALRFEP